MVTTQGSCNKSFHNFIQMLDSLLWTDIPGLISAALWKICASKHLQTYPERYDCVAVVTSGDKNSEVFLIRELAKRGFHVFVGVKHPESCERLQELVKNERFPGSVEVFALDFGSLKSVRDFCESVSEKCEYVNLLVNNHHAVCSEHRLTEDGFESNLALNYLGHFYLTHLLLHKMRFAGEINSFFSRVVNVTTPEFFGAKINFKDLNSKERFNYKSAYGQAKLAMLMMVKYMDELMIAHHIPVKFYAANSGLLNTSQISSIFKNPLLSWILSLVQIKPSESAQAILYACLSKNLEVFGGTYVSNCVQSYTPSSSRDVNMQRRLFTLTCELLNLKAFGTGSAELVKKKYVVY